MIQFTDLLLQDGTTIVLNSLTRQEFNVASLSSGLSDCDYEISFPNELNHRCFMQGFCFTDEDYLAMREATNPSVAMLGSGIRRPYDLQQEQEAWWADYRPEMQKMCAEQLFGPDSEWRLWSPALSSLGVLLEYHNVHDVTRLSKVFVSSGTLMFDLHVTPRSSLLPSYRLEYANSNSQSGSSSTMRLRVFREEEILKEINIVDYVPVRDALVKV